MVKELFVFGARSGPLNEVRSLILLAHFVNRGHILAMAWRVQLGCNRSGEVQEDGAEL